MLCSSSITLNFVWIWLFVLSGLISPSKSNPRTSEALLLCTPTDQRAAKNPSLAQSITLAIDGVKKEMSDTKLWGVSISGSSPEIYALAQCHEDLSAEDCRRCVAESESKLRKNCTDSDSGRIYLDGCYLRFDSHDFRYEDVDPRFDRVNCTDSSPELSTESYAHEEFQNKLDEAFVNVTLKSAQNKRFGAATARRDEGVVAYVLAQCWLSLGERECRNCLLSARSALKVCNGKTEGRALFTGCYVRYSTEKFFSDDAEDVDDDHGGPTDEDISHLVAAWFVFVTLVCVGAFIGYTLFSDKKKRVDSCVSFEYEMLERATDSFDESTKLGAGGAGSVFRGNLPDGRVVAVKRLFFNTRQWVDQFFNEVNLIGGIQHINLVRLLGISIEGPESLLVYEYVANRSLDQILFVKNADHILSWQQRFNIICGIAEGLAHLHEGCRAKIIHRDIKTSNVLLDQNLTPKIADFGLARCIGVDKTHTGTGIAGTLGYMAPEYLVKGQLTEKADVYAFGVVVLEVATGKKNSAFCQESNSILSSVWRNYESNTITEAIDPRLSRRFSEKEASKVLRIGLLCTQASVPLRPLMSEIVQMLRNKDSILPFPKQPPFLNASILSSDEDVRFSDVVNTMILNEENT